MSSSNLSLEEERKQRLSLYFHFTVKFSSIKIQSNTLGDRFPLFTIFALSAGFQHTKINIGNTGNQNHPDLKVRVVLVTCISNIDHLEAGNQPIMQKWSIVENFMFFVKKFVDEKCKASFVVINLKIYLPI